MVFPEDMCFDIETILRVFEITDRISEVKIVKFKMTDAKLYFIENIKFKSILIFYT